MNQGSNKLTRVIVRMDKRDREALKNTFRLRGHKMKRELKRLSALSMELSGKDIDALARTPGVLSACNSISRNPTCMRITAWTLAMPLQKPPQSADESV